MDKFVIKGGNKLTGEANISGAKNSTLALMPASILTSGNTALENTPQLNDVYTMKKLLQHLGLEIDFTDSTLKINSENIKHFDAPYEHVKKMRASVYVLGPLLSRFGEARVSLPGGCAWGPRPINLHLEAMKKLGAEIDLQEGYIIAKARRLNGSQINFDISSVGATGNTLMAAVLAKGETIINNAAIEPEITQLGEFLVSMGAKINGIGTNKLEIQGVDELNATSVKTISDRIETGTLLIAGAITNGNIVLKNCDAGHLQAVINKLEDAGCEISVGEDQISLNAENVRLKATDVSTAIFPGFPTDMQAQWTTLMCLANGTSTITDNIYFDRFKHIPELMRLGADITTSRNSVVVKGVNKLIGAKVMSTDLRASACLVLAGLAAEGTTEVLRVYHLDRGYQRIEEKLSALGADIQRVAGQEF